MKRPRARPHGFTLVEAMLAMGLTLVVVAAILAVVNPSERTFQAQPEVSDMHQRIRIAVDALGRDLLAAGAGFSAGPRTGALSNFFAPVMPFRIGAVGSDPPGTVRTDTITLLSVPDTCAQATLLQPMPRSSNQFTVAAGNGCPPNRPACCFEQDMQGVIVDHTGAWNTFVVTSVQASTIQAQRLGPNPQKDYDAGAMVAQVASHTYYLRTDNASETYQLMHYDGDQTDAVVVDNVVGLTFEYFGEPLAPALVRPPSDPAGPWTTYGPRPPALGASDGMGYPDGENCTFSVVGGRHAPRLADLGPPGGTLVSVTSGMLSDGPWCPGPNSPARFDADLLRIRRVQVTVRVQAGPKQLRGPAGPLFARAGYARGGEMFVPDQETRFDVTPRNLNLGR